MWGQKARAHKVKQYQMLFEMPEYMGYYQLHNFEIQFTGNGTHFKTYVAWSFSTAKVNPLIMKFRSEHIAKNTPNFEDRWSHQVS